MSDSELEQVHSPVSRQEVFLRKKETITPENVPLFYCNSVEIKRSFVDFALDIGIVEEGTPEKLVVRTLARLVMSPQHAKVLAGVFNSQVDAYEKEFGTITLPKEAVPSTNEPK